MGVIRERLMFLRERSTYIVRFLSERTVSCVMSTRELSFVVLLLEICLTHIRYYIYLDDKTCIACETTQYVQAFCFT